MTKTPTPFSQKTKDKTNPNLDLSNLRYLVDHIIKHISLPDFIESETGQELTWTQQEMSAKCCCPLHNEDQPSFNVDLKDGTWLYYCFGCQAKGNIIHFCKEYHGLRNKLESIYYICKKYKIENTSDLIIEGMKSVGVKIDEQRILENANILVSNQCRMLLRKNFLLHREWVSKSFKAINEALAVGDQEVIRRIDAEASKRMNMKGKL